MILAFQPGQSGNPGGRPAGLAARVREELGNDGQTLIDFWKLLAFGSSDDIEAKYGEKPKLRDRQAAADSLADRGYGKVIEVKFEGGWQPLFALPAGLVPSVANPQNEEP